MSWNRADEKEPHLEIRVLIYNERTELIEVGHLDNSGWFNDEHIPTAVTHWMHLPETPKQHQEKHKEIIDRLVDENKDALMRLKDR